MKIPSPRPALRMGRSVVQRGFSKAGRFGLLVALAGAAAAVQAAGASALCVLPAPGQPVTLEQLDAVALDCLKSAEYFQLRGQLELAARQPDAALVSFERALLIDPDHVGTQVDYVQTLIAAGDESSAGELLKQILDRDDVPARVRPALERQLAAIGGASATPMQAVATAAIRDATAEADPWFYRFSVSQAFGYDSNLNNAFSLSSLVLTGPQGNIELEVDRDFRPQRGGTAVTAVQWIGLRPWGESLWIAQADLRNRHTASNEHRYVQGDVALSWLQAPEAPSQWMFRVAQSHVLRAGKPLYDSRLASGLHQWTTNRCRIGAGLEVEGRRYLQSEVLDGNYRGLALSLLCPGGASSAVTAGGSGVAGSGAAAADGPLWGLGGFGISARLGVDRPSDAERAGGDQRAAELRTRWQQAWGATNLQFEYVWQRQLDDAGYSALLNNGAVRRITRNSLRLEASRPLSFLGQSRTQIFGSAELSHQRSNLQLFDVNQAAVMVGLRWALQ